MRKYRFKIDKLIRDKACEIMRSNGIEVFDRVMGQEEYRKRLKEKLLEEANEVIEAKTPEEALEEFADLLEVIRALGNTFNLSFEEIEKARQEKREEKGGFEKRVYGAFVEMTSDNKSLGSFLSRPDKYPEAKESGVF